MSHLALKSVLLTIVGILCTGCSSGPTPAEDKAAAIAAAQTWIDQDDCSVLSDQYVATWGDSTADGRKKCEDDTYKGLQKGEYSVSSASTSGDTGSVELKLKPAGAWTYGVVRSGGRWKIDSFDEAYAGSVGMTFPYRANYLQDDQPVDEDLRIRVVSVKDPAPTPAYPFGNRGRRYVRAHVRIKSNGPNIGSHSVSDFELVDTKDHRYEAFADYEPQLGNYTIELAPKDAVDGYISFRVPKASDVKEIRFSGVFSNDSPIVWKVKSR